MKRSVLFFLAAVMIAGAACQNGPYVQDESGVTVKVADPVQGGPALVRLQVEGEKIIRVSASPERKFADPQSLIIIHDDAEVPFYVKAEGDTVILSTESLVCSVLASTGELWFEDKDGNLLLREQCGGGKSFEPIEVDGTHGYSFRQVFESQDDEAFYGLGQHQADEFNYKGKNEELFQYNTKVSVPFIVSNKGYGVLMDSYSMMRFGNPEDYRQLGDVFRLYDASGKEGCLTGTHLFLDNVLISNWIQMDHHLIVQPILLWISKAIPFRLEWDPQTVR